MTEPVFAHRYPCNALTTHSDVDCSCGSLSPTQCAALSQADAVTAEDLPFQILYDALKLRCRRCDQMHLTVRDMPALAGFPMIAYVCRDCGLDSEDKSVP